MKELVEATANSNGIPITYSYREGLFDCRHLIVIFSGFGLSGNFTYDFKGKSLDNVPSHILWIKDSFYGNCCYYICHKMNFDVEIAVRDFIHAFCDEHCFDRRNVTLLGGSKGGSAALYFGIKYDFKNIISAAPQIYIGSFNKKRHPDIAAHMMHGDEDIVTLDNLFCSAIDNATNCNKNIYIFSSPIDEHEDCLGIHQKLTKFSNFNHIVTKSDCVRQHNQITSYNIPLILSILLSNGQGIQPRLGEWFENGGELDKETAERLLRRQREKKELVSCLTKCFFADTLFFPEGVAFFRGVSSSEYGLFTKNIVFECQNSEKTRYIFLVGSIASALYSRTYFQDVFCDYKTAGFASLKKAGISLNTLPVGRYRILMQVKGCGLASEAPLAMTSGQQVTGCGNDRLYRVMEEKGCAALQVLPALSAYGPDICNVTAQWRKGMLLHYEGEFLRYGLEIKDWSQISVWLVLQSRTVTKVFPYGKNNIERLNSRFDGFGVYEKSNFCSIGRKGVDLSTLAEGEYDVFITLQHLGSVFSARIDRICIAEKEIVSCPLSEATIDAESLSLCYMRDHAHLKANSSQPFVYWHYRNFEDDATYIIEADISYASPSVDIVSVCVIDFVKKCIESRSDIKVDSPHIRCSLRKTKGKTVGFYIYAGKYGATQNNELILSNIKVYCDKQCDYIRKKELYPEDGLATLRQAANSLKSCQNTLVEKLCLYTVDAFKYDIASYADILLYQVQNNAPLSRILSVFEKYDRNISQRHGNVHIHNAAFSALLSSHEENANNIAVFRMLVRILFQDSLFPPVLAYRFDVLKPRKYDKLVKIIKDFYSHNEFCHNPVYDLLLLQMENNERRKVLEYIFTNLNQMLVSIIFKNIAFDFVREAFIAYIEKNISDDLFLKSLPLPVLFEHVLLLSCLDWELQRAYIERILAVRQDKMQDPVYTSLEYVASSLNRSRPAVSRGQDKLKIALCVSGQLRGYEQAFSSWKKLGIYEHDVDTYVATWSRVGRKFPVSIHAQRTFSGAFLQEYKQLLHHVPILEQESFIRNTYPSLYEYLSSISSQEIAAEDLRKFYGSDFIYIEDDLSDSIRIMSNPQKMYYNIHKCNEKLCEKYYDLVIRIRPDLGVENISRPLDLRAIHEKSAADFAVFVNNEYGRTYFFSNMWSYSFDDSFAIGTQEVMQAYAMTYDNTLTKNLYKLPKNFDGHRSLAYSTFYEGVRVYALSEYDLQWRLLDPSLLKRDSIYAALQKDIALHPLMTENDKRLLHACEVDEKNTI